MASVTLPNARHGSQVNAKPLRGDLLGRSPSHQASTMGGEPKNTRHPSPSATNYNREDSFPRLSAWFVNLDSVPWARLHPSLTRITGSCNWRNATGRIAPAGTAARVFL